MGIDQLTQSVALRTETRQDNSFFLLPREEAAGEHERWVSIHFIIHM